MGMKRRAAPLDKSVRRDKIAERVAAARKPLPVGEMAEEDDRIDGPRPWERPKGHTWHMYDYEGGTQNALCGYTYDELHAKGGGMWCKRWDSVNCKDCLARRVKPAHQKLYEHKLGNRNETVCGLFVDAIHVALDGVHTYDEWTRVNCQGCLAKRPDLVHGVKYDGFDEHIDPARWWGPGSKSLCGASVPKETPGAHTATGGHSINCIDCLRAMSIHGATHFQPGDSQKVALCGGRVGSGHFPSKNWDLVTCPDCHIIRDREPVVSLLEEDAELLLFNSLVAARNDGCNLIGRIGVCGCDGEKKTRCIACAVLVRRGVQPTTVAPDEELARILALPDQWVLDLLKGWDGDSTKSDVPIYRTAYNLGRKLWRKHGDSSRRRSQQAVA